MSSSSIRLDDQLVEAAALAAAQEHRSAPKQIEYWAEIGRRLAQGVSASDLLMVAQGLASVTVQLKQVAAVDDADILARVEAARHSGQLQQALKSGRVVYQAAPGRSGYLQAIYPDGSRAMGQFVNGEFVAEQAASHG